MSIYKELLEKAKHYCTYQERCHSEVRTKLVEIGARGLDLENLMAQLIEENFLNEERFAVAFVGGKFRQKQWGRIKIRMELQKKQVSEYCMREAFKQLEEQEYYDTLYQVIHKKSLTLDEPDKIKKKYKLAQIGIAKGFENDLVWKVVNSLTEAV